MDFLSVFFSRIISFTPQLNFKRGAALLLVLMTALSGCASKDEAQLSEQEYYEAAKDALRVQNFAAATRNLEALETLYPFGRYAEQAQLDLIYARYEGQDLEGARAAADRFIRLRPTSEAVDYAYFIRGLATFNIDKGLAGEFFPIDMSSRDPGQARQAFNDFSELITRYPDSQYAKDAESYMIDVRNRLAMYELHAARYYIRRQAYLAAANRARYVVENFPRSPAVEEALIILVETQRELGLEDAADDALAVLAASYPESSAFDKSMRFKPSLLVTESRSLKSVFSFGLLED